MPKVAFKPQNQSFEVEENTKLLAAATRNKIPIRFGCASCRCGTCGIKLALGEKGKVTPMKGDEKDLLTRMKLPTDGTVRLACQTRILGGEIMVDLDFQDTYSPDQGEYDDEEDP